MRAGDSHTPSRDRRTDPLSHLGSGAALLVQFDAAETVVSWHLHIPSNSNPGLAKPTARLTSMTPWGAYPGATNITWTSTSCISLSQESQPCTEHLNIRTPSEYWKCLSRGGVRRRKRGVSLQYQCLVALCFSGRHRPGRRTNNYS